MFSVPPEDYMVEVLEDNGKIYCYFGIFGDERLNMVILGDAFLRAYYSIYDFEKDRVGIAVHKYSSSYLEKRFPTWLVVFIVLLVLCVTAVLAYFAYKYYKKRKQQRMQLGYMSR